MPSGVLAQWDFEPSVVAGILLLGAAYFYSIGPLRRRRSLGPPVGPLRITCFLLAEAILVFALVSPLDALGDTYLFSAHMVQHLLLASVWPPLLLIALPGWLVRPVFAGRLGGPARFLTVPVLALVAFNFDIYLWHFPPLYDLTLRNDGVHITEHLTFMAFGLLNWWPVLSPLPEQRLSYPAQMLYLFADGMFMMGLAILFTFSPMVFYSPYLAAPRLWGISAVTDQQLGGLIMWYPGNVPYAVAICVAFYHWFDSGETVPDGMVTGNAPPPRS